MSDATWDWHEQHREWMLGTLLDEQDRLDHMRDRDDLRDDKGE